MPSMHTHPTPATISCVKGGRWPQIFAWRASEGRGLPDIGDPEHVAALHPLRQQGSRIEVMIQEGGELVSATLAATDGTTKRQPPEIDIALLGKPA